MSTLRLHPTGDRYIEALVVSVALHAAILYFVPGLHLKPSVEEPVLTVSFAAPVPEPMAAAPKPEQHVEPPRPEPAPPRVAQSEPIPQPPRHHREPVRPKRVDPLPLPKPAPEHSLAALQPPPAPVESASEAPKAAASEPAAPSPPAAAMAAAKATATADLPVTPPSASADYLLNPLPEYPLVSRKLREEGNVRVRVHVDPAGSVLAVELSGPTNYQRLNDAAVDAVKHWKFKPARRGEQAVDGWVVVPVVFKLAS